MHSLKLILSNSRYFAVAWVFCSLNIIIGTWVLYIPYVKEKLQISDGQLGTAIFCFSLGVLSFLPLVPYMTKKIGLGRYTIIGIIGFSLCYIFPLLATNYTLLCILLFITGAFCGTTDVAMNALVSQIEKEDKLNFMSASHGFFSLGGAIGALLGSSAMLFYSEPAYHMLSISALVILINLFFAKNYLGIKESGREVPESNDQKLYQLKLFKPLLILAFVAFVIMSSEGAIEHWSNLYFIEVVQVEDVQKAGIGFIIFSVMMTIGRFFGDAVSEKIGSVKIIILGCSLAVFGYLGVLSAKLIISALGFGVLGLGLSVIIPELFRIAGKMDEVSGSKAISFVSGIGFFGFLLGPVVLGYISDNFGLKMSFTALLFLTVFAFLISLFKRSLKQ